MNIIDALGGWSSQAGPLYRQLATAFRRAIETGEIPPGTPLPAERNLARQLAVGRSTVVGAYDLLRSTGMVESRQGSGTWVSGAARHASGRPMPQESLRGAALTGADSVIDLATASLPAAPVVAEALDGIRGPLLDRLLASTGYSADSALGLGELRRAVAAMFTADGLPTTPDQVLITTGDQQALALICGLALATGDTAVVEDPTSPGILDLLRGHPVTVRSCRSLSDGGARPVVDTLAKANPALLYLLTHLGPEGRASAEDDLRALAGALRSFGGLVVEDTSSRLLLADPRPGLLARLTPTANVLTVGSMSKVFWGGLRVGWVRGDEAVILRLSRAKARADLGTPLLSQLMSSWLLGRLDEVAAARIADLRARYADATTVIERLLPDFAFRTPDGGVALWLRMPRGASRPFVEVAARHGVAVVPGSALSPGGAGDHHLRVALGPDPETFAAGIALLAEAWAYYDRPGLDIDGPGTGAPTLV